MIKQYPLQVIRSAGDRTFVATAKPKVYADRIVEHFNLSSLFDRVDGSKLDGTHSDKGDLIRYVLQTESLNPTTTVMVGDREHDMRGAKRHGIYTIGATYSYGTEQELRASGADAIADSPAHIPALLAIAGPP